jgi:acyl carrier protein
MAKRSWHAFRIIRQARRHRARQAQAQTKPSAAMRSSNGSIGWKKTSPERSAEQSRCEMFRAGMIERPRCVATLPGSFAAQNQGRQMHEQYSNLVIPTLARHLGVHAREISPAHDLFRDWGLTPLQLVIVLLDLERIVALELPSQELSSVRTVADLISKFRAWLRASAPDAALPAPRRARHSRHAQRDRRLRRELHFLRWLEHNEKARATPRTRTAVRIREAG